jgi:MFS family permease
LSDGGGSLRPTSAVVLAVWAIAGLTLGWLVHPLTDRRGTPPVITWTQPVLLFLVAAIVGATAWATWRVVHVRRERLEAHQGFNRLVLARACAYVGALVGGGYLGYALSWIGEESELADQRLGRSLVAAGAGALVVIVSLLLERACRVHQDGSDD